jgi:hypothetical protein
MILRIKSSLQWAAKIYEEQDTLKKIGILYLAAFFNLYGSLLSLQGDGYVNVCG